MDRQRADRLVRWFARARRDLPWRRRRTAYRALVAEAMLQQTQVVRVIESYGQFLRRFPTVRALAGADEQAVLAAWRGLGYYRRARLLHAAAQMIVDEFKGRVPRRVDDLLRLPGVGRYTAGAIASIVFGQAVPAVDGNVQRVLARWHAKAGSAGDGKIVAWSWKRAGELACAAPRPGELNEALMELGATICTPRTPECGRCPMARLCEAHRRGLAQEIPAPKRRAPRPAVHHHAVLIRRGDRLLLEQRPLTGLWAGMWQAPTVESERRLGEAEIRRALPVSIDGLRRLGVFEHQTTHRRITFHVFAAHIRGRRGLPGRQGAWRGTQELDDLPMSNAQRRVLSHLPPAR
ncbi:MAG: A/G-specific adenine glycosylase [Planctomycetota bacterium]|nr:A/G-specific adenine glycosylase [Planctomycetota bacterium]